MYRSKEKLQNLILFVVDTISVIVSYYVPGYIWLSFIKDIENKIEIKGILENEFGTVLLSYVVVMLFFNMNRQFVERGKYEEFKYVVKMNLMFGGIFAVLLFIKDRYSILPRGVFVLNVFCNMIVMYIIHLLLKEYLKRRKDKLNTNHILLITTSDRVESVLNQIDKNQDWLNRISGIAIVDKDMKGMSVRGIPVTADDDDMIEWTRKEVVDEVFISVPYDSGYALRENIMAFEDMGVIVHLSIEILENFKDFDKTLSMFGNIPVVTFANRLIDYNKLIVKRAMDIVGSIIGIIITILVAVFIAPAILIESRGPIIFKQKRVGKNGRYFYIYKFRSMYMDAEQRKKELMDQNEMSGLMFKMADDPRITKVGKFIRKTSIDELPQFFNVLKGDMSIVGTRPPTVDEFKKYKGYHKRRLSMKPGITGLWQVSGRSDINDFEEVVKMDLQYIDEWGLGQDMKIIVKTIKVIFSGKGAK